MIRFDVSQGTSQSCSTTDAEVLCPALKNTSQYNMLPKAVAVAASTVKQLAFR